jgi:hypothetical protein
VDRDVVPGVTYYYKLEDVDLTGRRTLYGPAQATAAAWHGHVIYLPLVSRR